MERPDNSDKIAKVLHQSGQNTFDKFEHVTSGVCSLCGAYVARHAKGFDEYCPDCKAYLDWSED